MLKPYYIPTDQNSCCIARKLASEGMVSQSFGDESFHPEQKILLLNGDGYQHHKTRLMVRRLRDSGIDNFCYLHIDAHDDLDGADDNDHYKSFVAAIAGDIGPENVCLFSDTLDLKIKQELMFYRPILSEDYLDWEGPFKKINADKVYVSVDLDCLDNEVHTLFPRKKLSGFNTARLIMVLNQIAGRYSIVGGDICGFSIFSDETQQIRIDDKVIDKSLASIVQIIKVMSQAPY